MYLSIISIIRQDQHTLLISSHRSSKGAASIFTACLANIDCYQGHSAERELDYQGLPSSPMEVLADSVILSFTAHLIYRYVALSDHFLALRLL
jgi:hypothetical protein